MSSMKEKIIDAAMELISKNGYEETSISKICDVVGVKKPTLYYHFESKEGLFLSIVENKFHPEFYRDTLNGIKEVSLKEHLLNFGKDIFEFYEQNITYMKLGLEFLVQAQRNESFHQKISDLTNDSLTFMYDFLKERNAESQLKLSIDLELLAQLLTTIILNAEMSFVMMFDLNHKRIWDEIVVTYFK